jgi:hypothetical protein
MEVPSFDSLMGSYSQRGHPTALGALIFVSNIRFNLRVAGKFDEGLKA